MKSMTRKDIAEAIGIGAVVASLLFVGMEIRQDHNLARAELASGTFDYMTSIERQLMSPDFAAVFEKMLENPGDLTIAEMTQVNGLLHQVIMMFQREDFLVNRGVFVNSDGVRRQFGSFIFGSSYAQSWLQANEDRINPNQLAKFRDELEALDPDTTRQFYERIQQSLR